MYVKIVNALHELANLTTQQQRQQAQELLRVVSVVPVVVEKQPLTKTNDTKDNTFMLAVGR